MSIEHLDAIIIGAGISGISAAYHFQTECKGKSYKVLERRENMGGTWDLFKYPGIRSDSDMYTFGFSFRPWNDESAIAEKSKIIKYLQETAAEYGIDEHIEYGVHVTKAAWSSKRGVWELFTSEERNKPALSCSNIFMCVGYYNYDRAYSPEFSGIDQYQGEVVHPQFWPEDLDYQDKKVVIVGSGATAVTLVPAMAEQAKHVTMLQRSPTYLGSKPAIDPKANWLAKWFGRTAARWWFILTNMVIYNYCKAFPQRAKQAIIGEIKETLGDWFEAKHYTPEYDPWDQRVCLCPDADFFEAIKADKASVVTDHIDEFVKNGIRLRSGEELEADIVVTATGLEMLFMGGIEMVVDGEVVEPSECYVYKGLMISGVPNMYIATGYTNASWTLKVDLTNRYACRVINYMKDKGYRSCLPETMGDLESAPLLDLQSGYIKRGEADFPMQSTSAPWKMHQNFILDNLALKFKGVAHPSLVFGR
jgi:cation diffusion facilitator CzcD-associated flavoprotein CzcO